MELLERGPGLLEDGHDAGVDAEAAREDLHARLGAVGRFQLDLDLRLEIFEKVFGDVGFRRGFDGTGVVVRIGVVVVVVVGGGDG